METIEQTHKKNLRLIKENSLKVGDILILKEDYKNYKMGEEFKIEFIHSVYGWVICEGEQLPQEVEKLLKITQKLKIITLK